MGWFFSVLIICASLASLAGAGNQKGNSRNNRSTFHKSVIYGNNNSRSSTAIYGGAVSSSSCGGSSSSSSCGGSSSSGSCGGGGYGGC
ncbi:hypothetical protein [Lyngbya sp. PCC 8106]|uniref:hypothetical protein n=1 Tax=Lyngbya sp. (strain PCC 8106) TaxID=313612 RepID=UPI0012EAF701|nr:hypothetical protein [Lyngbya sp. PCC 8106]